MSRHGFVDFNDLDEDSHWAMIRWRGAVTSAMRGKRGKAFFAALVEALDAMPEKALHTHNVAGDCLCAMGALARHRGVDLTEEQEELDDEGGDHEWAIECVGDKLDIAPALARETAYENDEGAWNETPEQRWSRMREWARKRA